ncbi:hypothetical protein PSHT_04316 [Puccinia striiformis]|uniref:Uncharacterized protein n=1 Tax=Puccinia striiformis TaxID=27350 RepID=A0A2S4WDD7_9BASI|nr:hypothetical protein PSHT_04316 [Puccinia striiformis]
MADDAKQVEVESLPPSRLGTQAFWDDNYGRELENFCEGGDEASPSFSGPEDAIGQLTGRKDSQILDGKSSLHVHPSGALDRAQRKVARAKGIDGLRLEVRDILREPIELPQRSGPPDSKGWDLITDKGTFDAICLSEDTIDVANWSSCTQKRFSICLSSPEGSS